jgi:ribosomal protein S25
MPSCPLLLRPQAKSCPLSEKKVKNKTNPSKKMQNQNCFQIKKRGKNQTCQCHAVECSTRDGHNSIVFQTIHFNWNRLMLFVADAKLSIVIASPCKQLSIFCLEEEKKRGRLERNEIVLFFLLVLVSIDSFSKKQQTKKREKQKKGIDRSQQNKKKKKKREQKLTTNSQCMSESTSNRSDFVIVQKVNNNRFVSVLLVAHSQLSVSIVSPREQVVLFCFFFVLFVNQKKKKEREVV